MPIYEYKCSKCGKVFEYKQGINDAPLTKCPESICEDDVKCDGDVSRIISKNVGLVFKGSGFYQTDYTKNKSSAPSKETETKTTEVKKETATATKSKEKTSAVA